MGEAGEAAGVFCACVLIAKRQAITIGNSFFIGFIFAVNLYY